MNKSNTTGLCFMLCIALAIYVFHLERQILDLQQSRDFNKDKVDMILYDQIHQSERLRKLESQK